MIIVMKPDATKENIQKVEERLQQVGLKAHLSTGEDCTIIGVIGDRKKIANLEVSMLEGVEKTVRITEKYKLVSRHFHPEDTIVDVDGVKIGGKEVVVMAGPCSVESIEQLREAAKAVKAGGAKFLRGGAFKPRTSPYDFQGLAEEGLKMLREVADEEGLKVVTEIVDKDDIELVGKYADIYQVGARNMQNFQLLKALGKAKKPVMLKRGLAATISEWLNAAEYIMAGGNEQVIFCERGIRTFEKYTRNTLDLSAVPIIHEKTHLPIIVDPSHATGKSNLVEPMMLAAIAAGADGLEVEVHNDPRHAWSDGAQCLTPDAFAQAMAKCRQVAWAIGREM